jgi:hypothetical protein
MLTSDDVPELDDFLSYFRMQFSLEDTVSDFMDYDTNYKAKLEERLRSYEEKVKEREAVLSQWKLLLQQPIFPWRLAWEMYSGDDTEEYYQRMGFQSEEEAIADTREVLLKVIQKLEETPVPEVKPK